MLKAVPDRCRIPHIIDKSGDTWKLRAGKEKEKLSYSPYIEGHTSEDLVTSVTTALGVGGHKWTWEWSRQIKEETAVRSHNT